MDISLIIVGLPRSRTAWLSVFMSQSDVYFYHEGLNGCKTVNEYKEKVKGCGDSSTGLMSLGVDMIGDSKVVVIIKNKKELDQCIEWCNKTYKVDSRSFILELNELLLKTKGLHVKQSEINDRLEDIWTYLVKDKWNDKYKNLVDFNIQVKSAGIDEEAAKALYESIQ